MKDLKQKILKNVNKDLQEIEIALSENLRPNLEVVSEIAKHILFSGGKRLRPLLFILCSRLCQYTSSNMLAFSTIFEYLHAATLLHDDFIDNATLRRGAAAAHTVWGNEITVLTGDFLLARSICIATGTENPKVVKIVSQITENMAQGEIDQLESRGNTDISEDNYKEIIRRKTAVLFQAACSVSAVIASATEEQYEALSEFGSNLGMAFQIADDLLDYTASTLSIGKKVGADLREGKITIPLIHTLKLASTKDRNFIESIIKKGDFSLRQFAELMNLLDQYGGIKYAKKRASEHIDLAKSAILKFPPSKTQEILLDIADYALVRKH